MLTSEGPRVTVTGWVTGRVWALFEIPKWFNERHCGRIYINRVARISIKKICFCFLLLKIILVDLEESLETGDYNSPQSPFIVYVWNNVVMKCSSVSFCSFFFFFWTMLWGIWESQFPNQGLNPRPPALEAWHLTPGPPAKSQFCFILVQMG